MTLEPTTYLCDACAEAPPKWRYPVPPGTPLMAVRDVETGDESRMLIADSVGLCDPCRAVMDTAREPAQRLAARVSRINQTVSRLPARARRTARVTLVKVWSALIPHLGPPVPCVRGDSPRDATIEWPRVVEPPAGGASAN